MAYGSFDWSAKTESKPRREREPDPVSVLLGYDRAGIYQPVTLGTGTTFSTAHSYEQGKRMRDAHHENLREFAVLFGGGLREREGE